MNPNQCRVTVPCSQGFGMAVDWRDLAPGAIQPAPLESSPQHTPQLTPGIHQKAPGHCRLPMPLFPALQGLFTMSSLTGSSQAGESKTERVQILSKLLSLHKGRLHRSSVSKEKLSSEMKQKTFCLGKKQGTVTKKSSN